MSTAAKRLDLCATGEVAPGTALKIEIEDLALAVFNVDGEFFVTDDLCTHGPGSLSEGYIDGDVVECNFHNGQFNIRTGEVRLPALHGAGQSLSGDGDRRPSYHRSLTIEVCDDRSVTIEA